MSDASLTTEITESSQRNTDKYGCVTQFELSVISRQVGQVVVKKNQNILKKSESVKMNPLGPGYEASEYMGST